MPGVPCRDRGNWDKESLRDRSHACFAKKAIGNENAMIGVVNSHFMQMGLVMSMRFIFSDD